MSEMTLMEAAKQLVRVWDNNDWRHSTVEVIREAIRREELFGDKAEISGGNGELYGTPVFVSGGKDEREFRDRCAVAAMQAMTDSLEDIYHKAMEARVNDAFDWADAMVAERRRRDGRD